MNSAIHWVKTNKTIRRFAMYASLSCAAAACGVLFGFVFHAPDMTTQVMLLLFAIFVMIPLAIRYLVYDIFVRAILYMASKYRMGSKVALSVIHRFGLGYALASDAIIIAFSLRDDAGSGFGFLLLYFVAPVILVCTLTILLIVVTVNALVKLFGK